MNTPHLDRYRELQATTQPDAAAVYYAANARAIQAEESALAKEAEAPAAPPPARPKLGAHVVATGEDGRPQTPLLARLAHLRANNPGAAAMFDTLNRRGIEAEQDALVRSGGAAPAAAAADPAQLLAKYRELRLDPEAQKRFRADNLEPLLQAERDERGRELVRGESKFGGGL